MDIILTLNNWLKKFNRVPQSQKIFFVEHLRVMIRAGISISAAIDTLAEQADNKNFKGILTNIFYDIEKGESLSSSLAKYPSAFDELFVNMIRAGEATGKLEEVLERLYIQMKKNHELLSKIKGALIYPAVILTAMILIGIGMMVFVIPRITPIFKEVGATLPLATRMLIWVSDFASNNLIVLSVAVIIFVTLLVQLMKTDKGKMLFDSFLLKMPIISPIVKKINLALFARTLSSLLKTDIPIVQTFKITSKVMSNAHYRQALLESSEKIKKGVAIKEVVKSYPQLFSPVVVQMIAVGEETGSLDTILEELANFYENEVSQIMNNLPSIIEPLIILLLGVGVAIMAIAVIMPLYSLSEQI
jgi:type IV pilus assembly protein PilC